MCRGQQISPVPRSGAQFDTAGSFRYTCARNNAMSLLTPEWRNGRRDGLKNR